MNNVDEQEVKKSLDKTIALYVDISSKVHRYIKDRPSNIVINIGVCCGIVFLHYIYFYFSICFVYPHHWPVSPTMNQRRYKGITLCRGSSQKLLYRISHYVCK